MHHALLSLLVLAVLVWLVGLWQQDRRQMAALERLQELGASPGDRVGVFVMCGDTPTHLDSGPLSGFTRRYDAYDWKLASEVRRKLADRLEAAGLAPIQLTHDAVGGAACSNLIQLKGGEWHVADTERLRALRDELRLKAMIAVTEGRVVAFCDGGSECDLGRTVEAPATGLVTRRDLFDEQYFAVAAWHWHVYWLDPPADFAMTRPMRKVLDFPSICLKGFVRPRNLTALTAGELEPVRRTVFEFVDEAASEAVDALVAKRLGQGARPAG